jgi:hypothetical protein
MHQPEKRSAVLKPDIPSDGDLVQIRSAPLWVPDPDEPAGGQYRLLYLAYARDGRNVVGMALAVSRDGLTWAKPCLGEVEVFGSKDNNWIPNIGGLAWPHNALTDVVYDPDDPDPERRYKGLLGAIKRQPVVSPDCVHWHIVGAAEIVSSDESHLTYDRPRGRFLAIVKTGNEYGRAFSISISEDFVNWTPNRFLFGADAEDQVLAPGVIRKRLTDPGLQQPLFADPDPDTGWTPPEGEVHQPTWRAETYNIAVFPYEGLYIGLPSLYYPTGTALPARNNTDGFHIIQLAMTRDLVHWVRLGDRQEFIGPSRTDRGKVGVFDRCQLLAAHEPLVMDDELWFYYSGLKWRAEIYGLNPDGTPRDPATLTDEERADLDDGWGAACLAVLRREGFISLDADDAEGYVLTKHLRLDGRRLFLNLAAPEGDARVEVLDAKGRPVPGYSGSQAVPVRGDGVRLPVRWKSAKDLTRLRGRTVQLKIQLTNAQLYAFWTE